MLRFAILGAGHGASVYLPAVRKAGHDTVVLASRTPRDGLAISQTPDWRAAIRRDDVDAVVIALPPTLQREAVLAMAGKPFLCEKPAGMNRTEAEAMLAASALPHAVGFQFRYEPGFAALHRAIAGGDIGRIEHIAVDWCVGGSQARHRTWSWRNDAAQGGGIVLNFATHALDYVRWLSGGEAVVAGRTENILVPHRKDAAGRKQDVTAPDACDFLLALESGGTASLRITNMTLMASGHRVVVRGDRGTLELWHRPPFTPGDLTLSFTASDGDMKVLSGPDLGMAAAAEDSRIAPTAALVAAFADCIMGSPAPGLPTLKDSAAVHRLLEA